MLSYWPQHRLWPQIVSYVKELSLELVSRPTFEPHSAKQIPFRVIQGGLARALSFRSPLVY